MIWKIPLFGPGVLWPRIPPVKCGGLLCGDSNRMVGNFNANTWTPGSSAALLPILLPGKCSLPRPVGLGWNASPPDDVRVLMCPGRWPSKGQPLALGIHLLGAGTSRPGSTSVSPKVKDQIGPSCPACSVGEVKFISAACTEGAPWAV